MIYQPPALSRSAPRTAIIYDALQVRGGMERVLDAVLELFPQAPIYTLVANPNLFKDTRLAANPLHVSFLQHLPGSSRHYRRFLPLMPLAVEQFDLREYDLVISLSYAVAHGVLAPPTGVHLSYLATPLRYAWQNYHSYIKKSSRWTGATRPLTVLLFHYLRLWTQAAGQRVDAYAACSQWIARCIWRAYQRPAQVIYPPVAVEAYQPAPVRQKYYVTLARLVQHKRLDLVIDAFRSSGLPLVVIGEGPERRRLERQAKGVGRTHTGERSGAGHAGTNIRFTGWLPEDQVRACLAEARGLVCAAEEDFGIGLVESQAAGCPVLAYRSGGAVETVVGDVTGLFFDQQNVDSLLDGLQRFEAQADSFDPVVLQAHAQRFNRARFLVEFSEFVKKHV